MNENLVKALNEFSHMIDGGDDYEMSLEFTANRFNLSVDELEKAYNNFVMSI